MSGGGLQAIERYLSPRARADIADAVHDAGGNEVFFVGRTGEGGLVDEVQVHCRGGPNAVPALLQVGAPGEVVIHNHPSGRLVPSEPDLKLASHYGQEGVGFFIVDNAATAVYVVVQPDRQERHPLAEEAVELAFRAEGALPSALPRYEAREQQVRMARGVARAQNEERILVAEAGTGTGKSLAYLLPAAMRALANGDRVAVATRTIALQQQLLRKDVPTLKRLYPDLQAALLQGRGNYLCRRKLEERLKGLTEDSDPDERRFLAQVQAWAEVSRVGARDDLPFVPSGELWETVQSNTEHTLRVRCPHYDRCFYYQSRRNASHAQLLLVNHHLLLADLHLRREGVPGGLLPRYRHVILDEAHHLEDTATDFAGAEVSAAGLFRRLGRLRPTRGRSRGIVGTLLKALAEMPPDEAVVRMQHDVDRLSAEVEAARHQLRAGFEDVVFLVRSWAPDRSSGAQPVLGRARSEQELLDPDAGPGELALRLLDDLVERGAPVVQSLEPVLMGMVDALGRVARAAEAVAESLDDMPDGFRRRNLQSGMDLRSAQRRLVDTASTLGSLLRPDPETCRWIEARRRRDVGWTPRFFVKPIEVGKIVQETLVEGTKSLVATSATLSVEGRFEHFLARSGLGGTEHARTRIDTDAIPSPFDYARQVLLGLPTDLPEPGRTGYDEVVARALAELIRAADGRTFGLFTSYRALRSTAEAVRRLLGRGYRIFGQGDLPRDQLLKSFRSTPRSALFGTDSFWEGVDVPGDALSCVVIPRLPFRVPSEPIQRARAERLEARGGDAFRDLAVPQAVLKFKQGFGRLIRHREDRGAVVVLDARILTKSYGRSFLTSLPGDIRPLRAPLEEVVRRTAELLAPAREPLPRWTPPDEP